GRLVSRAPDITRLLDKLASRGLVERERLADDRRVVRVRITEVGVELLATLREPIRECHARQLGHLAPQELNEILTLLQSARRPHEQPESAWQFAERKDKS